MSTNYKLNKYPGDDRLPTYDNLTTMFSLLKTKIQLEDHCVFLVAVMLGDCMRAMKNVGVANSGTSNQVRAIT